MLKQIRKSRGDIMTTKQTTTVKKANNNVEKAERSPVYVPLTDIYEENEAIVIVSEMPGVDEKNLDISIENDVLTLIGKQSTITTGGYHIIHRGYRPGTYKRSFNILTEVDQDRIKASLKEGILTVTLPKSEKAKPRKIKVQLAS